MSAGRNVPVTAPPNTQPAVPPAGLIGPGTVIRTSPAMG